MKVSLGAGLLFLLVLAAVFVPRALQYGQAPDPVAVLALRSSNPFVVEVVRVNVDKPLGQYRADLNLTGFGQLPVNATSNPLRAGPWSSPLEGNVSFADVDGDAELSAGDTFTIQPRAGYSAYVLLIFHESAFVDPQPPCPCAAARIAFP